MDHTTKLQVIDGETLMDMELAAPKFCVQGLLPQGLCILGGAPKIGKSWLMLDLCVRIAKGEPMWEMETSKGTTLYLCLEDTYFRIQQRLNCITDEVSDHAFFANASFSLAEGLMTQITDFVREHPDTTLVVIDTFQMVRSNTDVSYGNDYEELAEFFACGKRSVVHVASTWQASHPAGRRTQKEPGRSPDPLYNYGGNYEKSKAQHPYFGS